MLEIKQNHLKHVRMKQFDINKSSLVSLLIYEMNLHNFYTNPILTTMFWLTSNVDVGPMFRIYYKDKLSNGRIHVLHWLSYGRCCLDNYLKKKSMIATTGTCWQRSLIIKIIIIWYFKWKIPCPLLCMRNWWFHHIFLATNLDVVLLQYSSTRCWCLFCCDYFMLVPIVLIIISPGNECVWKILEGLISGNDRFLRFFSKISYSIGFGPMQTNFTRFNVNFLELTLYKTFIGHISQ